MYCLDINKWHAHLNCFSCLVELNAHADDRNTNTMTLSIPDQSYQVSWRYAVATDCASVRLFTALVAPPLHLYLYGHAAENLSRNCFRRSPPPVPSSLTSLIWSHRALLHLGPSPAWGLSSQSLCLEVPCRGRTVEIWLSFFFIKAQTNSLAHFKDQMVNSI